jgi:hypothetical protein
MLLQNVGAIHQFPFIRPVNSLLPDYVVFIITSEFTHNLGKSLDVQ